MNTEAMRPEESAAIPGEVADLADFLDQLACQGVHLWSEGGQLRYVAPKGALNGPERIRLQSRRKEAVSLLLRQAGGGAPEVPGSEAVWLPSVVQAGFARDPGGLTDESTCVFAAPCDVPALSKALEVLLERHSVLRTHFIDGGDGRRWAVTDRSKSVPLTVIDFRDTEPVAREDLVAAARAEIVNRRFDLTAGPLLRVGVFILEERLVQVTCAVHHSIFDGMSRAILHTELRKLYEAVDPETALAPLPLQFRDAIQQRRDWENSARSRADIEYWRRRLATVRALGWLPPDRRTPVEDITDQPCVHGDVCGSALSTLRALARRERGTLFEVCYSAFAILIWRWSSVTDVCTWLAHHGRLGTEQVALIGCFSVFWPLRVDLSGDPSFLEVLDRVRRSYREALPHAGITEGKLQPFIKRIFAGKWSPSVVFNYQDMGDGPNASAGQLGAAASRGQIPAGDPLALLVGMREFPDALVWTFCHSSHLFEEETVERAGCSFAAILTAAVETPEMRISQIAVPAIFYGTECQSTECSRGSVTW